MRSATHVKLAELRARIDDMKTQTELLAARGRHQAELLKSDTASLEAQMAQTAAHAANA